MTSDSAAVGILFKGSTADYQRASQQVRDDVKGLQSDFAGLSGILKNVGIALVSTAALFKALELLEVGEQLERVRNGFNNIVGNGPQNLQKARAAVRGTVDDLTLMRLASEAVQGGLNFEQVLQVLQYAEFRAGQFGETFETVFQQVSQKLTLMARGTDVSDHSLNRLQLTGKSVAEVMDNMSKQMAKAEAAGSRSSNTMAQFNAQLENLKLLGAGIVSYVLGPLAAGFNFIFQTIAQGLDPNRLRPALDVIADAKTQLDLMLEDINKLNGTQISVNQGPPLTVARPATLSGTDFAQALSQLDPEQLKSAVALLESEAFLSGKTDRERVQNLLAVRDLQIEVAKLQGKTEQEYHDLLVQQQVIKEQLLSIDQQKADKDKQLADIKANALRQQLDQERQLLEAKISAGQATYDEFRALLDKQYADNQDFFSKDIAAHISYITARGHLRAADETARRNNEAEIYNATKRFVEYTLADSARTKTQRLADAYEIYRQTLQLENLSIDRRRQIIADMQALEEEFTDFVEEEAARRVGILQSIFGNTFLQIFDDILSGSKKNFEEYLGDLGKAIAKFLLSQQLLKLFAFLATGPFAGLFGGSLPAAPGGIVGGGIRGGGGILGNFSTSDILRGGVSALDAFRQLSPVVNPTFNPTITNLPTPIQVQILADKGELYAVVREGERIYNKSAG